ncbi:MAG TPA: magnesium transporter [Anaerolineae bacterium]|nr:magnesium transporter [Anaerolineae bacterium]
MPTNMPIRPTPEEIDVLLNRNEDERLYNRLMLLHPADIAELLDDLLPEVAVAVFNLLPVAVASEVLDETRSRVRAELVDKIDDEVLADLLDDLPMDDAAEFLEDLPPEIAEKLLSLMEPGEAQEVQRLLSYDEDTAGRLMTQDVVVVRRHWTVNETLNHLRNLKDMETFYYLYVVDRHYHLVGVVPLRRLLMATPLQKLDKLVLSDVSTVLATADQEELAEMVSKYDYFAIPVVEPGGRFLGVVTVDDVLDIVAEETTEDIQKLGGSSPLDQPYFALTTMQLVRKRIVWLLFLFGTSILTDSVINAFDYVLVAVGSLKLFMPVITGTGGNAGSQTVTTIIRAMAVGEIRMSDLGRTLRREMAVGLMMGVILAMFGFVRAAIFNIQWEVALVLSLTLPVVVVWATTVATVVPIVVERYKIDPTVVSAPVITTLIDASGLFIYFSLAKWILNI